MIKVKIIKKDTKLIKRLFDIFVSSGVLILASPLICCLYLLVHIKMGSPVFFRQIRPGKDGKGFLMVKFRTMTNQYGLDGIPLSDDQRLTKFGYWLRATSLDELPELWNVLKGDMSLVGPRPLLMEYLPLYSNFQFRRHEVRPGITGLAQIGGRNSLSWEEKFALDIAYIDGRTFWLDLNILWETIKKVLLREGINGEGEVTMSRFTGKKVNKDECL